MVALAVAVRATAAEPPAQDPGRAAAQDLAAPAPAAAPVLASKAAVSVDWTVDGAITGGAALLWGGSQAAGEHLMPGACRWCAPPALDTGARDALRWSNPGAAGTASDLVAVSLPMAFAAYDWLRVRDAPAVAADLLVVAESAAITGVLTQAGKFIVARERPDAWAGAGGGGVDDRASFWSAHASIAFSIAASAGREAQLRGDPAWPWVYAVGFGAASGVGYLRVAADKHWLTDVLAGAAVGTAVGLVVPSLHGRPDRAGASVTLLPMPGGLLLAGAF